MRSRSPGLLAVALVLATGLLALMPSPARAFGDAGAFDPRVLLTGNQTGPARASAPARWAWELKQRTSAPARLHPTVVRADDPAIVDAPFLYWSGDTELAPLTGAEIRGLRSFLALGGILLVDDAGVSDRGEPGPFGKSARREIARVVPDGAPITIAIDHVIFRTFYLLRRAEGRVEGPESIEAIVRGGQAQVLFSEHDLGGALARGPSGMWDQPVVPGGDTQREHAIRLAVNIAMYVLCSNYKDDQVHAPFLMRRRALTSP
ncbi:MAG TPA: DUF4159 domain-containing protein [Polyangiaceae bacterium]|nr:DUF4159 domain-containing protein [Polyangiaceae bacterium]